MKKPMMYGMMLGGWTLGIYFAQMLWENMQMILITYQVYAFWYVLITGVISFIVCYRLGPPQNKRSKNLIRWGLQLFGLILVFFCSDFQEASAGIAILSVLFFYFPKTWITRGRKLWFWKFPPKPRLLTNEEFYEQGVRETTKALDELRSYCSSPECKQWSTMVKLKDPRRFASFMEGDSHLNDDEILEYEVSQNLEIGDDLSDDESDHETPRSQNIVEESDDDDDDYYAVRSPPSHETKVLNDLQRRVNNHQQFSSTPQSSARLSRSRSRSLINGSGARQRFIPDTVELSDDD